MLIYFPAFFLTFPFGLFVFKMQALFVNLFILFKMQALLVNLFIQ